MAGTTQDVIQKIENGKSLHPRRIEQIAKQLDVSPAWLQFGNEEIDLLDKETIEIALALAELSPEQREVIRATVNSLRATKKTP